MFYRGISTSKFWNRTEGRAEQGFGDFLKSHTNYTELFVCTVVIWAFWKSSNSRAKAPGLQDWKNFQSPLGKIHNVGMDEKERKTEEGKEKEDWVKQ